MLRVILKKTLILLCVIICSWRRVIIKKNDKQTSHKPNQSPYKLIENSVQNTQRYTPVNNLKFNRIKKKKDLSVLPLLEQNRRLEQRKLQVLAKKKRQYNTTEHLHPLNSERRRANRRKPSLKQ